MNNQIWRVLTASLTSLGLSLALAACGGSDDNGNAGSMAAGTQGTIRAVNGITDSTGLSLIIARSTPPPPPADPADPNPPAPPPPTLTPVAIDASNIPFGSASKTNPVATGYYNVKVSPAGGTDSATDYVPIYADNVTTFFTYGTTSSAGNFRVEQATGVTLDNNRVAIQLVHAAAAVSQNNYTLCVQLSPTSGQGALPLIAANFAQGTAPFTFTPSTVLKADTYKLQIYPCSQNADGTYGSSGAIVFDGGPKGISLPFMSGGRVLQIAVLDASASQQSQYGSAATLLVLDQSGTATPLFQNQN